MKRLLIILISLILSLSLCFGIGSVAFAAENESEETEIEASRKLTGEGKSEEERIDDEWFDDALFIGDSVTGVLYNYTLINGGLGNASIFYESGLSSYALAKLNKPLYFMGRYLSLEDTVAASGANKLFLMLTMNDMANSKEDISAWWGIMIGRIRERNPDVEIYIQSGFPPSQEVGGVTRGNAENYNEALKEVCEDYACVYVDVLEGLVDANGFLKSGLARDYAHLNNKGAEIWVENLHNPAFYWLPEKSDEAFGEAYGGAGNTKEEENPDDLLIAEEGPDAEAPNNETETVRPEGTQEEIKIEEWQDEGVSEAVRIEDGWFDDSLFLGDSFTGGLYNYTLVFGGLGAAQICYVNGLSCHHIVVQNQQLLYGGRMTSIENVVAQSGAKKLFLMIGMNDLGNPEEDMRSWWDTIIGNILNAAPDVDVYLQSVTPPRSNIGRFTLDNVNLYNRILREVCEDYGFTYVDIQKGIAGSDGFMKLEFMANNEHFNNQGTEIWLENLHRPESYHSYSEEEESA